MGMIEVYKHLVKFNIGTRFEVTDVACPSCKEHNLFQDKLYFQGKKLVCLYCDYSEIEEENSEAISDNNASS